MRNIYPILAGGALLLTFALSVAAIAETDECIYQLPSPLVNGELPPLPPPIRFERPKHDRPPIGMVPNLHGIGLNEVQQDKIFELMHRQAPLLREQAKAARRAEEDLHRLASAEDFPAEKSRTLAQAYGKAQAEIAWLRAETEANIRGVLSPVQRQQLEEFRAVLPSCDQGRHP